MKNILYWVIEVKFILACQEVPKGVQPSLDQNRLLQIQIQTLPTSMHHKWKEIVDFV
jgi:hypothetical protein